jgi:lipopolysaccharide transport system permease protein
VVQLILVSGCAMLAAGILPFLPDLRYLVNSGLQLGFFGTGIFYDIDKVFIEKHRSLVYLNPMAGLIKNYRQVLLHDQWPDWTYVLWVLLFAVCLAAAAIAMIRRFDQDYPRFVL